jgi:UDP-N-acetylglucosamine--N-acetylmuramyl-(pentapeptide) pyrophosphoryl-undecaprenol N-acetylglucosamine transferase
MAKRVVVTAGGSGGHILPAIAIAEEFRRKGHTVLYVGNKGSMEESIAQKRGFAFAPIDVQKIYRHLTFKHFLFPYKSLKSYYLCALIFKRFKPDVCVGTGGFVSGPVALKAAKSGVLFYL